MSLVAESNWELWETRDPHGSRMKMKQTIRGEPSDGNRLSQEVDAHPEGSKARRDQMIQNMFKHIPTASPQKSEKRRVLPQTPKETLEQRLQREEKLSMSQLSYRDPREGTGQTTAPRTIQPLPPQQQCRFFCTDTGPSTYLNCINCKTAFCGSCLHGEKGLMFVRGDDMRITLRCVGCGKNPYNCPISQRPAWVSLVGSANSRPGSGIEPSLGRWERHKQMDQLMRDKHLLESLRIPEDPNSSWRMEKIRAKTKNETGDEDVPDVFIRLLDHRRYSGTHKHRFAADGQGKGLEGRRDDDLQQRVIAGQGMITRREEPEMDSPHKPVLPWDAKRADHQMYYTKKINKNFKSDDAYTDESMCDGVMGRLANETAAIHIREGGDIYARERVQRGSIVPPGLEK